MRTKVLYLMAVALVLTVGAGVQAAVWTVDLETPHDFLTDGLEGTGWDGFIGLEPGETVNALNTSIDRPGQVYLESEGAVWSGPWDPLGPFLYKVVEGDFIATVRVSDYAGDAGAVVYHNDGSLAVRADPELTGTGENWVSLDYFPIWNCGNFVRSATNNGRTEHGHNGAAWDLDPWLQIEREGNTFHFRISDDGVTWTEHAQSPLVRDDFDGLPLQVGLRHATFSAEVGYIAFDNIRLEGPNVTPPGKAYGSVPANEATDVPRDTVLGWKAAEAAVSHDVYFGTVMEDVAAADRTNPLDVLVSEGQTDTTYDPGLLAYEQIYYWRIDEVEADGTIQTGDLWVFTAEPFSYPLENVIATASDFVPESGPEKTVDGSGLDADEQHSDENEDMWLTPDDATLPVWIQYDFNQPYKLHEMQVWNANPQWEQFLNFGVQDVTIEYAVDANEWTTLGDYTFEKGTGLPTYVYNTTIDFGGVVAKQIRINVESNYGGGRTGLSEVRFFYIPLTAREPEPEPGATDVDPDVVLSWRAGREAALHEVYLSTDEQAVADGTAPVEVVAERNYMPDALELGQTYYWRVDEVNEAETPAVWQGDIWNFSTPAYLVVDDFEEYDDEDNLIYEAWIDGFNIAANGSQVGYDMPPYAERSIVRSGNQSMPFRYGMEGAASSEATLTLDTPQDWARAGVETLVFYVRGDLANDPAQMYVEVNGTQVYSDSVALAAPLWQPVIVDLAPLGNAAGSVTSLTIGVSGAGAGLFYVDDVRLYREAPPTPEPAVDPGMANLMALYEMENDLVDGAGNGYDGTAHPGASFGAGPTGYGNALVLDGAGGYAELPIGPLVESLDSATFAVWVNWSGAGGAWQRAFDFGSGTDAYMFLTPSGGGNLRFAITAEGVDESLLNAPTLSTGWHHIAVAIDGDTDTMEMYRNGVQVASATTETVPSELGATTQNWIGRSQYDADAYFDGAVDDLRIYDRALSEPEIRYLVGDR